MSLIKCYVCQRKISENAEICPQCGDPNPQEVDYLLAKIIEAMRECRCPIGRDVMEEVCLGNERYDLFEKVCAHLVEGSIEQFKSRDGMWFRNRFRKYVPSGFARHKGDSSALIFSQHNHIIFALSDYFFTGDNVLSEVQFTQLSPCLLDILSEAPFYQINSLTRNPAREVSPLDHALLAL